MKSLFYTSFLVLIITIQAFGSGIGIVDGSLGLYFQTLESHTSVRIQDQIATVTCRQILKNTTGLKTTFKYGFPMGENASPISMNWSYEGVWKSAEVKTEAQNNSIPNSGTGNNQIDPLLINYLGRTPFYFSPKDTIQVDSIIIMEFSYVELLPYYLNKVHFYQKNNLSLFQEGAINYQSFDFVLNSSRDIMNIYWLDGLSEFDLTENKAKLYFEIFEQSADFDYNIEYQLSSNNIGFSALSTFIPDTALNCDTIGNGYFSFIIEPESSHGTEIIEKNFILIIDRSGSMAGDKIAQAKNAATTIVKNLNIEDYFNILDFGLLVNSLSNNLLEYDAGNLQMALEYIQNIEILGSTNISLALTTTIEQFEVLQHDKANIIIFLTDGMATAGLTKSNEILQEVENKIDKLETKVFLYTLGIGEDIDKGLLTLLARENNGLVEFVEDHELEEKLTRFFFSVNNPVLLNTKVSFSPSVVSELYPQPLPNLYKGEQLLISGRYTEKENITILVEGSAYNLPEVHEYNYSLSDAENNNYSFLPKVWVKQKLDAKSLDYYLTEDEEQKENILNEIEDLSKCYGVLALDFTSFEDSPTETDDFLTPGLSDKIKIFPNPCRDYIMIDLSSKGVINKKCSISIFNYQFQRLSTQSTIIENETIKLENLDHLLSGLYFISIQIGKETFFQHFVKL